MEQQQQRLPHHLAGELAHQPDVLLAEQKDASLAETFIMRHVPDLVPSALLARYKTLITALLQLLYYYIAIMNGGSRSIGEEYANISPVKASDYKSSDIRVRRMMEVMVRILLPLYVNMQLDKRYSRLKPVWQLLANCDLLIFFMFGRFRSVSRRLFGIKYVYNTDVYSKRLSYEVVGVILLARLLITTRNLKYQLEEDDGYEEADDGNAASSTNCTLCLSPRKHPTCCECGHVFCWKCITDWSAYDTKCPLCRRLLRPSRFIPLQNYS